jgi:hypothetical protein
MHQRLHPPIAIVWTNRPSNIQSVSFIFSFRKDLEPFDPFFLVFLFAVLYFASLFSRFSYFFQNRFFAIFLVINPNFLIIELVQFEYFSNINIFIKFEQFSNVNIFKNLHLFIFEHFLICFSIWTIYQNLYLKNVILNFHECILILPTI